jgi:hypothetical protein
MFSSTINGDYRRSIATLSVPYETTLNEGHGFSRAVNGGVDEGFSPLYDFHNRVLMSSDGYWLQKSAVLTHPL